MNSRNRFTLFSLALWCAFALVVAFSPPVYAQEAVPTRSQALASCQAAGAATVQYYARNGYPGVFTTCVDEPNHAPPRFTCTADGRADGLPASCAGGGLGHYFEYAPSQCAANAGQSFSGWGSSWSWPPSGTTCNDGCQQTETISSAPVVTNPYRNGVPTPLYNYYGTATSTGQDCNTDPNSDDPGIDEEQGQDAGEGWKCDPATGICTDPDGNGKLCTFNSDGSRSACVPYVPGDGNSPAPVPDEGDPNDPRKDEAAAGGASCDAPPSCSGGAIGCATLWQQWKTRCAIEKGSAAVGSNATCTEQFSTGYGCVGDAATCRNLNDSHAIKCAVLKMASATGGGTGTGGGDGDPFGKAEERVAIDAASSGDDGLSGLTQADAWASPTAGQGVSTSFFGGGGGCPAFPQVMIGPIAFQRPDAFCDYVAMIRLLVIALGFIWAAQIVIGD